MVLPNLSRNLCMAADFEIPVLIQQNIIPGVLAILSVLFF